MQAGEAGTGARAMMAHEAAADDRAASPCREGADQPALGLRWHGLLNRGVIDNQQPQRDRRRTPASASDPIQLNCTSSIVQNCACSSASTALARSMSSIDVSAVNI